MNFNYKKEVLSIEEVREKSYKDIYKCYDRPSITKINIFNNLRNELLRNFDEVVYYGVDSFNIYQFTINALVKNNTFKNNEIVKSEYYFIHITKTRNDLYIVKK